MPVVEDLPARRKVVAYVTHHGALLVFRHADDPQGGLQVPAGTVESGETLEGAILREAAEETGLAGLRIRAYLGRRERRFIRDWQRHHHVRYYYHLVLPGPVPQRWQHLERDPSDLSPGPIAFELHWLPLPVPADLLSAGLGAFVDRLPVEPAFDGERPS